MGGVARDTVHITSTLPTRPQIPGWISSHCRPGNRFQIRVMRQAFVVGFAPGHESLAHTVDESISIADLDVGMQGNLALARDWPKLAERAGF